MMTVDRTLIRAPFARIEVDTPFYTKTVETMCMKNRLFDLIIENVPGAREPNAQNSKSDVVADTVIRAQMRERGSPKPLKVKEMTSKMVLDREKLVRLQEEDSTFQKFKEAKGTETRKDIEFLMKNEKEFGAGYVSERVKWE